MILDFHLRLLRLQKELIPFNGNKYHSIFQFSDDGALETSELHVKWVFNMLELWFQGEKQSSTTCSTV